MADEPDTLARLRADLDALRAQHRRTDGCLHLFAGGVGGVLLGLLTPVLYVTEGKGGTETVTVRPLGGPAVYQTTGPPGTQHDVKLFVLTAKVCLGFVVGLLGGVLLMVMMGDYGTRRPPAVGRPPDPAAGPPPDSIELAVVGVRPIPSHWVAIECAAGGAMPWPVDGVPVELLGPTGVFGTRVVAGEDASVRDRDAGRVGLVLPDWGPRTLDDLAGVTAVRLVFRKPE